MAEPSASTVLSTAGVITFAMFPDVDGDAIIGSFAGAMLYAMNSHDVGLAKKLGNMGVSFVVGYLAKEEAMRYLDIESSGVAAFLVSLFLIVFFTMVTDRMNEKGARDDSADS